MYKYEMIVYWSDDDEAFIVDIPVKRFPCLTKFSRVMLTKGIISIILDMSQIGGRIK